CSVRIFNPDGSEAEKSGNGLRIFAKWLFDTGRVRTTEFVVTTPAGPASIALEVRADRAHTVTVDMGKPSFREDPAVLELDGMRVDVVALSIGNPHCVVVRDVLRVGELRRLGPRLERHPAFPKRTNVQLA